MSNPALAQSDAHCLTLICFLLKARGRCNRRSRFLNDPEPGKVVTEQSRHAARNYWLRFGVRRRLSYSVLRPWREPQFFELAHHRSLCLSNDFEMQILLLYL